VSILALNAAVAADPADLTARLVRCDWLQEYGTEDDWHAALDAHPDHHELRLRFADWLELQGDPRAEGYRALGLLRLYPCPPRGYDPGCPYWIRDPSRYRDYAHHALCVDWFALLDVKGTEYDCAPMWSNDTGATRRGLEDAAALAFSRLPADRRAELLGRPAAQEAA
jgi:uncharacterized protein (TIGR02996 family)